MREIKFRGKSKESGKWVYGYHVFTSAPEIVEYDRGGLRHVVNGETVGQFTGLYDKENNEIYEGDIFERNNHFGIVEFNKGQYYIRFDDGKIVNLWVDSKWNWKLSEKEKAGNKVDNSDLFKRSG